MPQRFNIMANTWNTIVFSGAFIMCTVYGSYAGTSANMPQGQSRVLSHSGWMHEVQMNKTQVDWSAFDTLDSIEAYFTQQAVLWDNPEAYAQALMGMGFTDFIISPQAANSMAALGHDGPGVVVTASWDKGQRPFPFSLWFLARNGGIGAVSFTLSHILTSTGEPIEVRASFTRK